MSGGEWAGQRGVGRHRVTLAEAPHSAASSLSCPGVRAEASMSPLYQPISELMEAFPIGEGRAGLLPAITIAWFSLL